MNPIEHCWDAIDRQIPTKIHKNKGELLASVRDAWQNLSADYLRNLVDSMPRRVQALLKARGGSTPYWLYFFNKFLFCSLFVRISRTWAPSISREWYVSKFNGIKIVPNLNRQKVDILWGGYLILSGSVNICWSCNSSKGIRNPLHSVTCKEEELNPLAAT